MSVPKCPRCKSAKHARAHGDRQYYCALCDCIYDGVDDGTVTYGDPARIAANRERQATAEKYHRKVEHRKTLKGGLGK